MNTVEDLLSNGYCTLLSCGHVEKFQMVQCVRNKSCFTCIYKLVQCYLVANLKTGLFFFLFLFTVKRFVAEDRLPHLLFYGPPGTGKTSTILALAKQIYAPREFNSMVLEVTMMVFLTSSSTGNNFSLPYLPVDLWQPKKSVQKFALDLHMGQKLRS